ncbi:MAG: hypothetical protein ACXWQ5_00180 [Ktedonobacterales bacterium]
MASFNLVTSGNPTLASDINQYANILNGSVAGTVTLLAPNSTTTPLLALLPSAPAGDTSVMYTSVSGDATSRMTTYIRGSDGYGGITAGAGPTHTAHWYATSSGWKTDESIVVATNLTVNGSTSIAALTASGNASVGGNLSVTGTFSTVLQTTNVIWVNKQTAFGAGTPAIDLAIGDNDTGWDWAGDGHLQLKLNGAVALDLPAGSNVPLTDTNGQKFHVGTSTPSGNESDVWFKA